MNMLKKLSLKTVSVRELAEAELAAVAAGADDALRQQAGGVDNRQVAQRIAAEPTQGVTRCLHPHC